MRPVTGTEPAAEVTQGIARFLPFWDAAQVRANADHYQPLRPLDTRVIPLRVFQGRIVAGPGPGDLLWRAMIDKYRFPLPHDSNPLAELNRLKV